MANTSNKKYTLHVISGTHWDREWRHTAEQSKLRLAELMDTIIEILENKPEYEFFCVDGGTIVIEDYLTVRPENEARVKRLIESGKMILVKWYTLPETNTVAPESLVRNLLLGQKMAHNYGGGMKSGYTATSYGQHSQMPQLYQGFGIETAIFYRGTNKHVLTPLFVWEGVDGSTLNTLRTFDEVTRTNWFFYVHGPAVLGKGLKDLSYTYDKAQIPVHMADMKSYEKAFVLLKECKDFIHDKEVLAKSLNNLLEQAMPYRIGRHILALNMEDNDEPYIYLPELIAELNKLSPDIEIVQDTMDSYMDAIISDPTREKSARHKGELRYTTAEYNNFNALLGATHSSRIKIKISNEDVETNLINLCEPLASMAWMTGAEYPTTMLDRSWSALLKNHAHDSICGAAVDRAHEDMMYNFSMAKTVAEEVTDRSVVALYKSIDTGSVFGAADYPLVVVNTLPYARREVIQVVLDTPKGAHVKADIGVDGAASGDEFYDIVDADGKVIPSFELSRDNANIGVERELDTKAIKFKTVRRRVLVEVDVPAMGYKSYALRFRAPDFAYHPQIGDDRKLIARDNGTLENEYVKVTLNANGTFDLVDKVSGRVMSGLGYLTDEGEVGSAHISVKTRRNKVITSLGANAAINILESNELRGVVEAMYEISIPAAATIDGTERTREYKTMPVKVTLTLEKGAKMVKLNIKLNNQCRDHKLSVNFPSGIKADYADSESAWAVASRTIKWADHKDNFEGFFPFQPMQNFVDVSDGKSGFAILNKGLREYEVGDDTLRTVKITLIRTQRAYMTANSEMLTEELDRYTGQHSIGDMEYNLALMPHEGNWEKGRVLQVAYEFKTPVKAIIGVPVSDGNLPHETSLITITPTDKIMLSGMKRAEDGSGIVVRLWNATDKTQPLHLSSILPVKSAALLKMDESYLGEVDYNKGLKMDIAPHKIVTLLLRK